MLKTGDWYIEPGDKTIGRPPRVALIIEPMETVTPVEGDAFDYYRAVDFADRNGPRHSDRYGIRRESAERKGDGAAATPTPQGFSRGGRVVRRNDARVRPVEGTVNAVDMSMVLVCWDNDPCCPSWVSGGAIVEVSSR